MSTRSIAAITDGRGKPTLFYRHSDGYPDGVRPTLDQFCEWLREGKIRNNATQSAGWLVLLGHREYVEMHERWAGFEGASDAEKELAEAHRRMEPIGEKGVLGWKSGAYEPMNPADIGSDVAWLHVININKAAWHPVAVYEHPLLLKVGEHDHPGMPAFDAQAAYLEVIQETAAQLESGELASWQPEPETSAPA